jgi:hypothetical protein
MPLLWRIGGGQDDMRGTTCGRQLEWGLRHEVELRKARLSRDRGHGHRGRTLSLAVASPCCCSRTGVEPIVVWSGLEGEKPKTAEGAASAEISLQSRQPINERIIMTWENYENNTKSLRSAAPKSSLLTQESGMSHFELSPTFHYADLSKVD